jgi:pyrroloquinoline quinone biosynthesis protein E
LEELVGAARSEGLYVNLITSGIGLTEARLDALEAAGLDHVQLSLQGIRPEIADRIGGYRGGFERKVAIARSVKARGFPLTLNAVMHRQNIDDLPETIAFAADLGVRRLEIACVQFYGWALKNRAALQPTREQVDSAKQTVARALQSYRGQLAIDFVPPDYYADYPKACMGGWGSTGLNIAPDGTVLPCHAAQTIRHLTFQRVTETPLGEIWANGQAFQAFRGHGWMQEPCRSCARRDIDHGGCRCQAMAIAGDPFAADPVCRHSAARTIVDELLAENGATVEASPFVYRR